MFNIKLPEKNMSSNVSRRRTIKQLSVVGIASSAGPILSGCGPAGEETNKSLQASNARTAKAVGNVTNFQAKVGISSIEISATVSFTSSPQKMFAVIVNADFTKSWTLPATDVIGVPPSGTWKGKQDGLPPGLYHTRIWTGADGTYVSYTDGPSVTVTGTSVTSVSNFAATGGAGNLTITAQVAFTDPQQKLYASISNENYTQNFELPSSSPLGLPPSAQWTVTKTGLPPGLYHTRIWWGDSGIYNVGRTDGPDVTVLSSDPVAGVPYTDSPENFEIVGTWAPVTQRIIATYPGAITFDVGPGKPYAEVHDVPWQTAPAGSVMNIHFRPTPYRSIVVHHHAASSEAQRYIINGVTNSEGVRPYLSGRNASYESAVLNKRAALPSYLGFTAQYGQFIICTESFGRPQPNYLTIQNLDIFECSDGVPVNGIPVNYSSVELRPGVSWYKASCIWALGVKNLIVNNCNVHDSSNGIFVNSLYQENISQNVVLRNNKIWNTGGPVNPVSGLGDDKHHSSYCAAINTLYEGNDYGRQRFSAVGSSLKDRSSNCTIRANRISANARCVDLVEDQSEITPISLSPIFADPTYNTPWIYCNIFHYQLKDQRTAGGLFHLGFDTSEGADRRIGTCYFFNNSIIFDRKPSYIGYSRVDMFDHYKAQSSDPGFVDHDNVFLKLGDWSDTRFLKSDGRVTRTGTIYQSWGLFDYPNITGTGNIVTNGTVQTSGSTFDALFRPVLGSNIIGKSIATTWQVGHEPNVMWSKTLGVVPRLAISKSIGALEPA
jgi:uncharacterized protein YndB with AHSA1/START domain